MEPEDFWTEAIALVMEKKMERILVYMYLLLDKAHAAKPRPG